MPSPAFRLPGVYFAPTPRPAGLALPPLDVAAFVGFAERGPLDLPTPVDDLEMYRAIFGGDLALARGPGGRILNAQLPRAVAAFFANGGRRCYVVRVAGRRAKTVRCQAPSLVALDKETGEPRLAALRAASPGRWADGLRLATRRLLTPLPPDVFALRSATRIDWETGSAPQALEVGDLLRLTLTDGRQWLFPIAAIERPLAETGQARLGAGGVWREITPDQLATPLPVTRAQRLTLNGLEATGWSGGVTATGAALDLTLVGAGPALQQGDALRLELDNGDALLFPLTALPRTASASPPGLQAQAATALLLPAPGSASPDPLTSGSPPPRLRRVERLRFSLRLRLGEAQRFTLAGLAFNAGHSRFWGDVAFTESSPLPHRAAAAPPPGREQPPPYSARTEALTSAAQAAALFNQLQAGERAEPARDGVLEPRLLSALLAPLAGGDRASTLLPLGMPLGDGDFAAPLEAERGDDDLALFAKSTAGLFLDPYLFPDMDNLTARVGSGAALLAAAAERYYGQNRRLQGLHSLLFIDEVALASAPDTAHPGWRLKKATASKPVVAPTPAAPVVAGFAACRQPPTVAAVSPAYGPLTGAIWVKVTGTGFMTGSDLTVRFGDYPAQDVQTLNAKTLRCRVPPAGQAGPVTVEVCTANGVGRKTNGFIYQPPATTPPLPEAYSTQYFSLENSPLLPVQQALLQFCQARADVVGVLSLPAHFAKRQCIDWQETLRQRLGLPRRGKIMLDAGDGADLSYIAVYHPWLLTPDLTAPDGLSASPPDGAICGSIAARERDRQAWIAPANTPLRDVVDLSPAFSEDDWAELFALQFNLIRPEPRGFLTLSAHTLSAERALLQLSARRLLILLRKLALARGEDYVFAANTEALRNAIRLELENILRRLFEQGAFAGSTQPSSFRIAVGADLNPLPSIEQGRLLVQIQVAPSQPLEFINVLLLRTGEGLLQAVEA